MAIVPPEKQHPAYWGTYQEAELIDPGPDALPRGPTLGLLLGKNATIDVITVSNSVVLKLKLSKGVTQLRVTHVLKGPKNNIWALY